MAVIGQPPGDAVGVYADALGQLLARQPCALLLSEGQHGACQDVEAFDDGGFSHSGHPACFSTAVSMAREKLI
jgi:hypothetical protein